MVLQIERGSRIENPREYDAHTVAELQNLLAAGVNAQCDPVREYFYELEGILNTYYIHVSPITGNAVLLAKWARQPQNCYADSEHLVA